MSQWNIHNNTNYSIGKDYIQDLKTTFRLKAVMKNPKADILNIQVVTYYDGITMDLMNQYNPIQYTMRNFKVKLSPNIQQIEYLYSNKNTK